MKKIWKLFLLLFVFISFINLVYALDCQYTQPNYATKEEIVFYENGKKLDYQVIEIKDFSQGVYSQIYVLLNRPAQFTVYNHHPSKKLLIEIFFTKNGNLDNATIEVDPLGYKSISRDYQDNIDFNTIRFRILDESINVKNELIEYIVDTTCKLCNSKICLDDGASCKSNNECGSGICNIADFCGKEKVVACEPYGKLNCNNQTCLMPSTKEVGDAYSCNWECKSDRYEEGICLKSSMQLREEKDKRTRNIIIFGVIIFVVILISYLYIEKRKRGMGGYG